MRKIIGLILMALPASIPLIAIYKDFGLFALIESILIVTGGVLLILLGVYLITDDEHIL